MLHTIPSENAMRNMDVIRALLLAASDNAGEAAALMPEDVEIEVEGLDVYDIAHHVELLIDAGYVKGAMMGNLDPTDTPSWYIYSVTWQGYDLLDAIRDQDVWARTKGAIIKGGGSFTIEILKGLATKFIREKVGLPAD